MITPLVSIWTTAYNHAPFIRQCIEGVLIQKTTFPFELLIHDDASTDETADIIREYETRYPDVIKPIYQTENLFSKGVDINSRFLLPKTQGKYIALCEGDDYWTNPLKLQKQVDFLEAHPDYSICGGMYRILKEGNTEPTERDWLARAMTAFPKGKTVTLQNYLKPYMLQYLTICFRKDCCKKEKIIQYQFKHAKDDTLWALLLEQGKGFVFPDYFGVYRMHQGGVWAGKTEEQQLRSNESFLRELVLYFGKKSKSIREMNFDNSIKLRFIELKTSKHPLKDYMKIVLYTFSGNMKDIPYQFRFFYQLSRKHYKNNS